MVHEVERQRTCLCGQLLPSLEHELFWCFTKDLGGQQSHNTIKLSLKTLPVEHDHGEKVIERGGPKRHCGLYVED